MGSQGSLNFSPSLVSDSGVLGSRVVREAQLLFLQRQKKKDFTEESMTQVGLDVIGTFTLLDSNKRHVDRGGNHTL